MIPVVIVGILIPMSGLTVSRRPSQSEAITGRPAGMASIGANPNYSCILSIGKVKISALE